MLDKNKVRLGIAPIAWTNDDLPDLGRENTFEQCVSEMALAGFTGSEVGNKYPKDTEVLKKALELRNIEICNQWFSSFLLTKSFEEVEKEFRGQLEFLKAMGARIIGASEQSYSVQGQEDTPLNVYDGLKPVLMGLAAKKSSQEHRPVKISVPYFPSSYGYGSPGSG